MATSPEQPTPAEARGHLMTLIRDFDTAMVTTHGETEKFHARPMAIARIDDNGQMFFAAAIDSPKVDEIKADSEVLVTFQADKAFVAITGRCSLNRNRQLIHELWKPAWKLWFQDKDDPRIVLLEVTPASGEYWDNSRLRSAALIFDTIVSMIGGKQNEIAADVNNKVDLGHAH